MKLEKSIVFNTQEELNEAIKFKVCSKRTVMSLPYLLCENGTGLASQFMKYDSDTISIIQNSVMWSDVREDFIPKKWYELEENIGKTIMVRDEEGDPWYPDIFSYYDKDCVYNKFMCENGDYEMGRPLTKEEITLVGETDEC